MFWGNTVPPFLGLKSLKTEAVCSSKTLVSTYKFTQHHNLGDQHQNFHCHENVKSQHGKTFYVDETLTG
jgi:hypothetical protein